MLAQREAWWWRLFTATSSPDAFGADANRLEMRFWPESDRLDIAANTASVPSSWFRALL